MLEKFKALSAPWKIAIGVVALIVVIFIFDQFTGFVSDFKSWHFDKEYEARMVKVEELEKTNIQLRFEKKELEKKALELEAKNAIYEEKDKKIEEKVKVEIEKLDQALLEQDRVEAETSVDTDAFTRCTRVKEKLIAAKVFSAQKIDCEVYK